MTRRRALWPPLAVVGAIVLVTLAAPLLPLPDPTHMDMAGRLAPPSWADPLGRDEFGRDVLSRILWGARASLAVSVVSSAVAATAGTLLGLVGGYFRGVAELLTVRASEVILCLPPLLLALLVVALLGPGAGTLILCLSILYAPGYARVAFAATLSVRALDYVAAQQTLGTHPVRIVLRTVLPNVLPPLIVQFSLTLAAAMVLESGLSFLGLGVVPPAPSWGLMIQGARGTMAQAPLLLVWPCLALSGVVLTLNTLCDRLRDVLDPRTAAPRSVGRRTAARLLPGLVTSVAPQRLVVSGLTLRIAALAAAQPVIRDVSFTVGPGQTVALVGESGSGKTLTGLALMGLLPSAVTVVAGRVDFTRRDRSTADLLGLSQPELRRLHGNEISMVFQDPSGSLDPVQRVGDQVAEAIRVHGGTGAGAVQLLADVGLPDPARQARAYPHELSGGQKQRVLIAAAIANNPLLLVADEPTTALDVTIQAQILDLLAARKDGMGMIFITHNLAVVAQIADRVCIMYAGEIVEQGSVGAVFAQPLHPYTAALLASVPEGEADRLLAIPGTVPSPADFPPGCRFAPRCGLVQEDCRLAVPPMQDVAAGHATRCFHWRQIR